MVKKRKKTRKIIVLASLSVLLAVLVIIFFSGGVREKIKHFADQNIPKPQLPPAVEEHVSKKTVTLFFLSEEDDKLHREIREIDSRPSIVEEAEQILAELIKGSNKGLLSPLPAQTRIRQIYISSDGVAYVDFSKDLVEKFSYGSSAELSAVYAIVDSLAFNFKSIKKVAILIEGSERETLGGHIDISKVLVPNYTFVAK